MPLLTVNVVENGGASEYVEGAVLNNKGYKVATLIFNSGTAVVSLESDAYYVILNKPLYTIKNPYLVNLTNDLSVTIDISPEFDLPFPKEGFSYIYSITETPMHLHYMILGGLGVPNPGLLIRDSGFTSSDETGLLGFFAPRNSFVFLNLIDHTKQFLVLDTDYMSLQKIVQPRVTEFVISGPDTCQLNTTCVFKTYIALEDLTKQEVASLWTVLPPSEIVAPGTITFKAQGQIEVQAQTTINGRLYQQTKIVTVT